MTYTPICKIQKEQIASLKFTPVEVLGDTLIIEQRKAALIKAMLLGNGEKNKVRIVFEDNQHHSHEVETTVWYTSEKYVVLKSGTSIPISSISEVLI